MIEKSFSVEGKKRARGQRMREPSTFGVLLKHYRLMAGFSQEALAARTQLSSRAIGDLERGISRTPRPETLALLSTALSLTPQQRTTLFATARPELAAPPEGSPTLPSSGLPLAPTRLIGREQELMQVVALLRSSAVRLLTLTGPSGVGKTRLALQVAHNLSEVFVNGTVFVSLAPIQEASRVPGVVAQALGLREQTNTPLFKQIHAFIQAKHILLVLDNFEHVLQSAVFVADLLALCPQLCVLATSRTPLGVRTEQRLPIAPLALAQAVMLFQERAQAIQPGRTYAEPLVENICERVDSLPLAIELAAMHVNVLALPELYKQLTHRLDLLRGGARDLPIRQQTMEEAIAWSYELLTVSQQCCFRGLSVFVGGWTLEAAEAVYWNVEEVSSQKTVLIMASLVDAGLVQAEIPGEGIARFSMLEVIREYALKQLRVAGDEEAYRQRHATYYAHLGESIALLQSGQGTSEAQLVLELPNAGAALQWVEERQKAEQGLLLAGFGWLWYSRGQISEAQRWLESILSLDMWTEEPATLRVKLELLYGLGRIMLERGSLERAEALGKEALKLAQGIGDQGGLSNALANLGVVAQTRGKMEAATIFFRESYAAASQTGSPIIVSRALHHLADIAMAQGDIARATELLEEGLANVGAIGMEWGIAMITTQLGHLAREQQNYDLAKARYRESLALLRTLRHATYLAWSLEGFAASLIAEGHHAQATRLCAAAVTLRERIQTPLPSAECEAFDLTVTTARAALDERTFAREWNAGTLLTQDEAIDDALSDAK